MQTDPPVTPELPVLPGIPLTPDVPEAPNETVAARTASGAVWLILLRLLTRTLGFVSTLVLAHRLLPADFGLVAMATTLSAAVESLSEIGLQEALIRRKDNDRLMYDTAFTLGLIRSLLSSLLIAGSALWAESWFHEPRIVPILLIIAGLSALGGLSNIGVVEYRRNLRFSMEFALSMLPRFTAFAVTVAWAFAAPSYWALIAGVAAAKVIGVAITYVVHPYRPRLTLRGWRELAGFSFWSWVASLVSMVWWRCDPFILGPALGPAALGLYLLSSEIGNLPTSELVSPITVALFAGFSMAQNRGADTVAAGMPIVSSLLMIVVPLAVAVSGTAGYIVAGLLGPAWGPAQPLIATLAWLSIFAPVSFVVWNLMSALGRLKQNVACIALAATFKIIVVYAASRTGNVHMVATAAVVVVGLESGIYLVQLRLAGARNLPAALGGIARIAVAASAAAAALYASGLGWGSVTLPALPALALGIATGIVTLLVYTLVLAALFLLAGRPEGPETRVVQLFGAQLARLRKRPASA